MQKLDERVSVSVWVEGRENAGMRVRVRVRVKMEADGRLLILIIRQAR